MEYSNILKALNTQQPNDAMADMNRRTENYRLVDQLNNEGISLKDVLGQIDDLKKKVEGMEKPTQVIDEDLFAVMESSVKDDPAVVEAKRKVAEEKTRVIAELCSKDSRFMAARDEYRRAVNRAYVAMRESAQNPDSGSDVL